MQHAAGRARALAGLAPPSATPYRQALRNRDLAIATAAHELQGPLTALLLQAQHWQRRLRHDNLARDELQAGWQRQSEQLWRISHLVDRLLDVRHLGHGRLRLQRDAVDLNALLHEVAQRLSAHSPHGRAPIRMHLPDEGIRGHWDRLRIEQVVENLLSNALKYGEGRPVDVAACSQANEVIVRVKDHGKGIDKKSQRRIFARFARGAEHGGPLPGLGLGLWIARRLVRAHGGRIEVHSAVGQGAEFVVVLPGA